MLKLVFSLLIVSVSLKGFAKDQNVYDQCSGRMEKSENSTLLGFVQTKISKDVIIISEVTQSKTHIAQFKIQQTSMNSYNGLVYIKASLIKNEIASIQSAQNLNFTANYSLYYGDPDAMINIKDKNNKSLAIAVAMSCNSIKSPNQKIKLTK